MRIALKEVDSYSELVETLRQFPRHVLCGQTDEAHREYFIATGLPCVIGVCSQGSGIRPTAVLDQIRNMCWIGYNSSIACIDIGECETKFVRTLPWVYYDTLEMMPDASIIVVHELGLARINLSGEFVWSYHAKDIVTDFSDEGAFVRVRLDDGQEEFVDKQSGIATLAATK